jgi:hypothetical protein
MKPEIPITVAGYLGAWQERMMVDAPGMLWIAWLRHPAYGLLGIFVLPKAAPLRAALPEQSWVTIQGLLRPCRVAARAPADPRSEWDGAHSPLLIHAITILMGERAPRTSTLRHIQVRPGRWSCGAYLAPARHLADVVVLTRTQPTSRASLPWRQPYGVSAWVGTRRYLRYVLVEDEQLEKHHE